MPHKDKEKRKEYHAKYYIKYKDDHKKEIKEYAAKYKTEHQAETKNYNAKYWLTHQEEKKEYNAKYKIAHREKIETYRENHREETKEYNAKYRFAHKKGRKEYKRGYEKQKRLADQLYKMKSNLRTRTCFIFKKISLNKPTKTENLLGANWKTVMRHIESQFTFGMSWENYGEWHIDHKKPLATAKTEKQLIKLCNYTNLQPLWAEDNMRKQDKIDYTTNAI